MENIVTETHTIRLGEYEDIPQIIEFIREEWNSNHIYVKSREFFEYEHCIDGRINGILAINNTLSRLEGIMLFYQTKRELRGADFYGGIWRVSEKCVVPMIGLKMVYSVQELTGVRGHNGIGINPETTVKLFRYVKGQTIGKLEHFYRLMDQKVYKVAVVKQKRISVYQKNFECKLEEIFSMEELKRNFKMPAYEITFPYKDEWYLEKRYFMHPIYKYHVYEIWTNGKVEGILVSRTVQHNGANVLRIVDFLGNKFCVAKIGKEIQRLMEKGGYEYVDFYEYGIDDEIMEAAGFVKRDELDENIIPNYFEPFVCENIDLWFHSPYTNFTVLKGDGDQDRPNILL